MGRDGGGSKTRLRERTAYGFNASEHKTREILCDSLTDAEPCCQGVAVFAEVKKLGEPMLDGRNTANKAGLADPTTLAAEDVEAAVAGWLDHMAHGQGLAANTVEAYARDL